MLIFIPLFIFLYTLYWWKHESKVEPEAYEKCVKNMYSGHFNVHAYRVKYGCILPWMYTYRSLNTFCRRNLKVIIGDNIFYYLQNDKIALSNFLCIHNFKRPENIFSCRDKPDATTLQSIVQQYFRNHKNKPLVIKPSNLSFSEGVAFLKNEKDISVLSDLIDDCYKYNCSFTEGSDIDNYAEKKGLILQEAMDETENVINEWKIMYIWGVPIVIHWKIGHVHRYKIMKANYDVLYKETSHGIKNIYQGIPPFAKEMLEEGERLCKLTGTPFLRVDMLWNDETYIINETELLPSNYMFFTQEKEMMGLLKIPLPLSRIHYGYELFAYAYYIFHYIEYRIRRLNISGLYKNLKN